MPSCSGLVLYLVPLSIEAKRSTRLQQNSSNHYPISQHEVHEGLGISLDAPPERSRIRSGWTFGGDPSKCDVLLRTKRPKAFAINFHPETGILYIENKSREYISLDRTILEDRGQTHVVLDHMEIEIDKNIFRLQYPKRDPRSQSQFEERQRSYRDFLRTCRPNLTASATATPLVSHERVGKYVMMEKLGSGTFGDVFQCTHVENCGIYAAKRFKRGLNDPADIKNEIDNLKRLNHVSISP